MPLMLMSMSGKRVRQGEDVVDLAREVEDEVLARRRAVVIAPGSRMSLTWNAMRLRTGSRLNRLPP